MGDESISPHELYERTTFAVTPSMYRIFSGFLMRNFRLSRHELALARAVHSFVVNRPFYAWNQVNQLTAARSNALFFLCSTRPVPAD
jgi:hypothetical protein